MRSLSIATIGLFLSAFAIVAADNAEIEELESRVKRINALGQKPGMMNVALQRISTETGVPLDDVRDQHKKHPDVGVGGLMIANVLANESKKSPSHFLTERAEGRKWLNMARQNKVSPEKLNDRLERLEKAIKGKD